MTDIRKAGRGPADLILRGVCKSFGTHVVLKDLSLRFVADPENGNSTCVLFEVTDIQYSVHSSLPILANP